MEGLLEMAGAWLARAFAFYGLALVIASFFWATPALFGVVVWLVASHSRGHQPWPKMPVVMRRWARLAVETSFGLINPVLYLAILAPSLPELRSVAGWWPAPLTACAWILLAAFWALRIFGAALDPRSRTVRAGIGALLAAALACLLLYTFKDAWSLPVTVPADASLFTVALLVLRLCPLYLIPAVLLWDHIRAFPKASGQGTGQHGLFLLRDRPARFAVAGAAAVALVTLAFAAHRRSEASVRRLVGTHRESIREAASRYDVDARLIAAIVYVTHRDQLSPFRDALERIVISAWARNMRREVGTGPPDNIETYGTDENPSLNRALDISVGLAQIKPRTAQTASVLAAGLTPDELPRPAFYSYRDVEPPGGRWNLPPAARISLTAPLPVPAERQAVADVLLDSRSNLAMCALILALYQRQWEATNPAWRLHGRPDILATLYQLGFARSRPHGAPRSSDFGARVRQVYDEPWLAELLDGRERPPM